MRKKEHSGRRKEEGGHTTQHIFPLFAQEKNLSRLLKQVAVMLRLPSMLNHAMEKIPPGMSK